MMDILKEAWSPVRIIGDSHSSLIDLPLTQRQSGILSVAAWYDNEWGFSSRLEEVAAFFGYCLILLIRIKYFLLELIDDYFF